MLLRAINILWYRILFYCLMKGLVCDMINLVSHVSCVSKIRSCNPLCK